MSTFSPEELTRINFYAATAFVRAFYPKGRVKGSHAHGKQRITLDDGWIIIDQVWSLKPQKPVQEIPELTEKRKKKSRF